MEAEGQDKERRIDELETQLEQQSTEHKRDFNRLQTEQNLADEKARKRIEDLENEKEGLLNSQTTALNDQQKFFEKQIERMRADYLQTVEQITKERQEAEERNEVLEQQNKDLATRFDKPISEMRADHQEIIMQAREAIADLRKRLDDSEATRRQLDQTILSLLNGRKPEELNLTKSEE